MPPYSIQLKSCSVRLNGQWGLKSLDWTMRSPQHWAILGPNGAGKTTFMRLIRGELHPAQGEHFGTRGRRKWDFGHGPDIGALDARANIALLTADDHDAYIRDDRDLTAEEVVITGIDDTLALFGNPDERKRRRARNMLEQVGAAQFANRSILTLSRGQARLVLLARALVRNPAVLLLDEAFEGLDTTARRNLSTALETIAAKGVGLVLTSHYAQDLPDCVTHALVIENGTDKACGPARDILNTYSKQPASPLVDVPTARSSSDAPPWLVDMVDASIDRGGKRILSDINWRIAPGDRWVVCGENGSGKSTLTALAYGALRPSCGSTGWFGSHDRASIWDIRSRIGLVSPELQAGYRYNISALDLVASGFFSSVGLWDRANEAQLERATQCIEQVGLAGMEDRPVRNMSYGQLRRLIIARALVHDPDLLLLDEPCAGLDAASRREFIHVVDTLAQRGVAYVFVTHRREEAPRTADKYLAVADGRVTQHSDMP